MFHLLKKLGLLSLLFMGVSAAFGQNFELIEPVETLQAATNQNIRVPIRIKNNTDKAQFYIIRKSKADLGESQKGYFCFENKCLDHSIDQVSKLVEPGETLQNFYFTLESGVQPTQTSIKLEIFPKGSPAELMEHNFLVVVEEKSIKNSVFQSKEITIYDVYPNPIQDQAFVDYKINFSSIKVKIVVHNILGKSMAEFELPYSENRLKILAEEFPSGVYFYTVYINDNGILTRKVIVRK